MVLRTFFIAILAFSLCACGQNTKDRAMSGAGIGAPVGLVVGAVVGSGYPVIGTLAGAALGATIGAQTDSTMINFGEPLWNNPQFRW